MYIVLNDSSLLRSKAHGPGFALVATVSMMVLMTLIAVGMLSLSTIEQRSSGGGANEADRTARANARMALMIALGELQKAAGPDQRVTATASILGSADNPYATGTPAQDGRRHWVGVWDTSKVRRDVNGDGDINNLDKTFDTNGDGEGDEFPPYSPADPDKKEFVRWLVSGDTNNPGDNLDSLTAVRAAPSNDDVLIFEGLSAIGLADPDGESSVKVPKVEVATSNTGNTSYYAYWVEDEGVKADLAWNEMPPPNPSIALYSLGDQDPQYIADMARWQAARLSNAAGPDYLVFDGTGAMSSPFEGDTATAGHVDYQVTYPLLEFPTYDYNADGEIDDADNQNPWIAEMKKAMSIADIPLVMWNPLVQNNHSDWLKTNRHDMAMNVRGVMADVKKGGLRRDLSLAFEMDGSAESESATLFNQQTTEFVGNGDVNSSPYITPSTTFKARNLFRDYGPKSDGTPGAGGPFSNHITQRAPWEKTQTAVPHVSQERTVVRGPSWWLMRDYANLYKRMRTPSSGSGPALSARAYFPNRTYDSSGNPVIEDFVEIYCWHAFRALVDRGTSPVNREVTNVGSLNVGSTYLQRPVRASYAPVVIAANALLSVVYEGGQLKLVADPFFILWNPYNTHITADRYAITLNEGFFGGVLLKHRYPDGTGGTTEKRYGRQNSGGGSSTTFANYAERSALLSGESADINMSYLISDLTMGPGEVMIFSPPNEAARSANANARNDELLPGMNYDASTSGIFFDEFPEYTSGGGFLGWTTVNVPVTDSSDHTLELIFNLQGLDNWAKKFLLETSIPAPGTLADQLTSEAKFGANLSGWEYRVSRGSGRPIPNCSKGVSVNSKSYSPILVSFDELSTTKKSFGIISLLTMPTDHSGSTGYPGAKMEVFSQLNVTPVVKSLLEQRRKSPINVFTTAPMANGINNLMQKVGIDIDAFGDGNNGFYGKSYSLAQGDSSFPIIDIPRAPMCSLVQLSGANIGIRLFEPTNAIGNSWKPPYTPQDSIYLNSATFLNANDVITLNDVSWQANDALFDGYYFSGIAPEYTIGAGGYAPVVANTSDAIEDILQRFYGMDPVDPTQTVDPATAKANPALEPHVPSGKNPDDIVTELTPTNANHDGYQKVGAYCLIKGAFNVNSTSVKAWAAFLKGNKAKALTTAQGTTESGTGTPFPLASTTSNTSSNNGWENFSRLTDEQIWDDNDTPNDFTDDTGLAVEIVKQVKTRGPFMSISDFVNRRIAKDTDLTAVPNVEDTDPRAYQGAVQEAIEQAGINDFKDPVTNLSIRDRTSDVLPNYKAYSDYWCYTAHRTWYDQHNDFPYSAAPYASGRNCATGVPLEINQANILLPLAPKLSARTDTFKIRGYGEVRDSSDKIIAQATCEAVVQRLPEYVDPNTDPTNNEPWDDDSQAPTLNSINQTYGRRFEMRSFRWLDVDEA